MAYKSINSLMDDLKADLEWRYNVKCRFVETTVPNSIRLVCQLIGASDSQWLFTYCFNPVCLMVDYNFILGESVKKKNLAETIYWLAILFAFIFLAVNCPIFSWSVYNFM